MSLLVNIWIVVITLSLSVFQDNFKEKRERMVKQQIERRGVKDPEVLKTLRTVERHLFVPSESADEAYDDRPLPIGFGQTISQPFIVAYMTEIIEPKANYKVLEIGTGSGYQAAVLAHLVKEVYTIEIVSQLGNTATTRLRNLGYKNVQVRVGDGYYGWKEAAPFDAIVVTAAAEYIPPPLLEQLKDGGKMVIPVGSAFMNQNLMLVEKKGTRHVTKSLMPVVFVPFTRKS
jgi:protein-L-isoaspartate(D-aspartate) O-methyltransferase